MAMFGTFAMTTTIFLFYLSLTLADVTSAHPDWRAGGNQQPLRIPVKDTTTVSKSPLEVITMHSTKIFHQLQTITLTRTRYTAGRSTAVPHAVQVWHGKQKHSTCDPVACASCREWYEFLQKRSHWWATFLNTYECYSWHVSIASNARPLSTVNATQLWRH